MADKVRRLLAKRLPSSFHRLSKKDTIHFSKTVNPSDIFVKTSNTSASCFVNMSSILFHGLMEG